MRASGFRARRAPDHDVLTQLGDGLLHGLLDCDVLILQPLLAHQRLLLLVVQ